MLHNIQNLLVRSKMGGMFAGELKLEKMYEVLDLFYTEDECQSCFAGTFDECQEFVKKQGGATFMYKIVPIVNAH